MFEWLSKFKKILVTGPQRSGTRICSKMIAYDTGYEFIDEASIAGDSLYRLSHFLETERSLVIQCPIICRNVHMFKGDNIAIVFMRRSVEDIVKSQERIGWRWEWLELARYDRSDGVIAEVKYQFWDQYQKERIQQAFEVEYESLTAHPLWVTKELRQTFNPMKTSHTAYSLEQDRNIRITPYVGVHCLDNLDQDSTILVMGKENARLLNDAGKLIWHLCDGTHTRQDILEALQVEFNDVDKDILASDMDEFVWDLVSNNFLHFDTAGVIRDDASKPSI
jgi:hypothetical protein